MSTLPFPVRPSPAKGILTYCLSPHFPSNQLGESTAMAHRETKAVYSSRRLQNFEFHNVFVAADLRPQRYGLTLFDSDPNFEARTGFRCCIPLALSQHRRYTAPPK